MKCSIGNVVYLTEASIEACASMPVKDVGPLSKEDEELVTQYRQMSPKNRAILHRLAFRWLNQPKSDKEV